MKPKIFLVDDRMTMEFTPLLGGGARVAEISRKTEDEWPINATTATTDMRDFIANIKSIEGDKCSVEGVYRGRMLEVNNVKVCSPEIKKPGDRVMVTEHVSVDGRMDFIATKKRVLAGNVNFVKIGWSNERKSRFLVLDVYTGDSKVVEGPPMFFMYTG